jgi:anti-sigma factor RsiW
VSHLGRWLSALVDGELDGTERDRVLNHVAGCQSCRKEAIAMRALKRRLTALGETSAEQAIASRLIELARGDQAARVGALQWPAPAEVARLGVAGDWGTRLLMRTWRLAAASAGGSLIAIGAIAFLLGNGTTEPPAPKVTPSVDSYLVQHAFDAGVARAGSVPPTGSTPAYQGPGQAGPGQARLGQPAARPPSHGLARPAGHGATGVPAASSPREPAAASPTASPDFSPSPSSPAGPSSGPQVTSLHRG